MALTKITRINTKVNVVEGLETRPQMPPQTLKQKFDEDSVNLKADVNGIVDGVNAVIDELTSTNGAKNIGTAKIDGVVGGNVQDVMQGLIPKTDIVQALGSAADKIISQKAVTDAIGQKGGGDMLKAVYDTTNNGVVDDAEKLGGQLPAYYAKITDLMYISGRGYNNDANNIPNGVTWCVTNTPNNAHSFVWQIQYDDHDKVQLSILCNKGIGAIAYRSSVQNSWSAWQEMMPKSGGNFSGMIKAPQVEANALSVGNDNISTNRISFPASGGSQVGSDAYGCAGSFSTNGFYVKGLDNTWKPVYASTFSQQSSIAEKSNIKIFKGGLEILIHTNVYWYERLGGVAQIGLVIEDKTTPNEVKTQNAQGLVSIDLYSFISLVSQAVKELKAEKDTEIAELKAANTAILKRLEILEGKVK